MSTKKVLLFSILGLGCVIPPAQADLALAVARNCMACHAVERKVVGPSFRDIAARYREDKGAVERLARKIVKGAADAWGAVRCPRIRRSARQKRAGSRHGFCL